MTEKNSCEYTISNALLNLLEEEHPNILPDYEPSAFDLGVSVGEQRIIKKIKMLINPNEYELKENEED